MMTRQGMSTTSLTLVGQQWRQGCFNMGCYACNTILVMVSLQCTVAERCWCCNLQQLQLTSHYLLTGITLLVDCTPLSRATYGSLSCLPCCQIVF